MKRVALELGGKSAQIYLPDALGRVGTGAAMVVAMTAGQACVVAGDGASKIHAFEIAAQYYRKALALGRTLAMGFETVRAGAQQGLHGALQARAGFDGEPSRALSQPPEYHFQLTPAPSSWSPMVGI